MITPNEADKKLGIETACAVLQDLGDRRGVGDELDQVDKETRTEIYLTVGTLIAQAIADAREAENEACEAAIKCECSCCDRGRGAIAARRTP